MLVKNNDISGLCEIINAFLKKQFIQINELSVGNNKTVTSIEKISQLIETFIGNNFYNNSINYNIKNNTNQK